LQNITGTNAVTWQQKLAAYIPSWLDDPLITLFQSSTNLRPLTLCSVAKSDLDVQPEKN